MNKDIVIPSVSKILNPIAFMGLIDVDREKLNNSAKRGDRVHNWIQAKIMKQPLPKLQQQDIPYIQAMNKLMRENPEHRANILGCECEVDFNEGEYKGRLDFFNKERKVIYELKTTSSITLSHKLQLYAYDQGVLPYNSNIISLKKDGTYKIYHLYDWDVDYLCNIWTCLITLYYMGCKKGGSSLKNIFTKKLTTRNNKGQLVGYAKEIIQE